MAISSNARSHAKNPEDVFVAENLDSIKEIGEKMGTAAGSPHGKNDQR